ncbi:MAG: FAD/NAD(P)-binding oxidoreductase [Candidatus Latescibacterota bacterium]
MKRLVILGAGTAGTMMVNKLFPVLDRDQWEITIVDQHEQHYYQPGFLFVPFDIYSRKDVVKPKRDFLPKGVAVVMSKIDRVEPDRNRVILEHNNVLAYDYLLIATGAKLTFEETEGLTGELWRKKIFDFYTIEGAFALCEFLKHWEGGKLVVNIAEMPIKCPVAPLEFIFLADWFFTERGIREKVDLHYVTPLPGAFTKPRATEMLGDMLDRKNIRLTADYSISSIDNEKQKIVSYDEKEIDFDLLVTVPTNVGDPYIERSGMGDDLNFVPTDKHTLRAKEHENIFVMGDAADLPSSKAGSVAHFQSDILMENLLDAIEGKEPGAQFDGHANCFIESGFGKGILIDFNYETEPLPGKYPLPGIGPFSLLQETRWNHYGKMMFRWAYWNVLLKGLALPVPSQMSMVGKKA